MRNWKQVITAIMGCLLCIVMATPVSAAEKFKNPIYKGDYEETEYDYVDYGMYPQWEITGEDLTKEIINASYNEEGDAVVNGELIRRISFDEIRRRIDTALLDSWEGKDYRYYKYEPIQWRVLNCDGDSLMLLSEKVLDFQYYNRAKTGSWDESELKQWLNSSFLEQAFTKNEQEKLLSNNGEKVTLPSDADVLSKAYGFADKKDVCAVSRRAWTSEYAEDLGAYTVTEGDARENTYWCTKDFKNDEMIYVQFDGQVKELPISTSSLACVRPVIRIPVDDSVKSSVYLRHRMIDIETLDKYKLKLYSPVPGDRIIKAVSSKPYAATVSNSGTITALRRGETNITVTTRSGRVLECYAFVTTPHTEFNVETIPLQVGKSTTDVKLVKKKSSDSIKKWESLNPKIASVNKKGKITARKKGTVVIYVRMKSSALASCVVKVQKGPVKTSKIAVNETKVYLKLKGKRKTFQIKVKKEPITTQDKITYKSSNKKIATVSSKGKITAKKAGRATITVKCGKKSKEIQVKVTKK